MKKSLLTLLLLTALLVPWAAKAQTPTIETIGTGTETNNFLPFRCYRNYSVTQQIYTTEELGAPGFIQSIDFFKTGTLECSRNIDIYMIHTDLDDYATQTDNWIPVNSDNLVFSGTVTFGDNSWTTITLDTPFDYDGLHNVAIVIDDNTGSFTTSEVPFLSFTTATEQGFYTFSFTDNFPPTSMPESSWGIVNQKNQIRVMKLAPAALPYSTGFETTCDWQLVNGDLTNVWTWGTAAHNGSGTHGLYISNDGGATNAYTNTSEAMVYAYKTFNFETGLYHFSYDWLAYGENNYDFLRVALVPANVVLEASTALPSGFSHSALPSGWIALDGGSQLSKATEWQTVSQDIEIATAGEYMMVFAWRDDSSVGTNPPAAIDNVSIEVVTCPTPLNLSVSNLTATSADLSWNVLTPTDSYTVKYRTAQSVNAIFTEGFEGGSMPSGWTQSGPGTWNVTEGYGFNSIGTHSGTYNATINHTSRGDETFLVSPMLDLSGQSNQCLSFWYINFNWGSADIDQLNVYYRVNEGEWIELWNATEDHQEWTESGFIALPNPSANYQIGFKMIDKYGHGVGLDDIMIGPNIAAGAWQTSTVAGNASEMSTTLTGLTPETEYEAYVYPDCNPDNVSETVRFTTANEQTLTIETIGTGTYSSSLVFPGLYNYQYTVSLYKPDMAGFLNDDFNLSSIAYDVVNNNATIDTLTIWVKDVDYSEYSVSNYVSSNKTFASYLEGATQVYATTTSFNLTTGWNTFNFTTNFSHRAGNALLVIVRGVSNNTVGPSDSPHYRYTYKPNTVWYTRRNYNLGYPGSGENDFNGDLANIQLGLTYATGIPSDLTVTYPEGIDTQVTLGWTENGEATAWQICLNDDETHLIEANSNPFTLTNLTPETTYTAKVRANHGDTQSDWSTAVSFTPTLKTVLGTATGTIGFLPCNPNYEYSMTQQIYTAAELGNAADLVSIDFYNDGTDVTTRNLQIYMTHTDQNAFASLYYDWINVASTDLVFSGPVHFVSKGWKSIVLDKPFAYDGQHNVVITVDDNTGSYDYQSGVKFLCYSVPGAGLQSKYFNDVYNHNYDPTNNPGSSTYAVNQKNHIRVMKAYAPTDLTVSDVTSQGATLGWTQNGPATSWQIFIGGDMNDLITVTENPYTLTGLTPGTAYTAKVRAICTEGHTSWSNEVNFATFAAVPYATDFEVNSGWQFVNGTRTNQWCWGTAAHNGTGTHGIYISNDGGTTNAYTFENAQSMVYACKNIYLEEGYHKLDFDWRNKGETNSNGDYIRAVLLPASTTLEASAEPLQGFSYYTLPDGWIAMDGGSGLKGQTTWQHASNIFRVYQTGYYKMVFAWFNDFVHGENPPAAIDNVEVVASDCPAPSYPTAYVFEPTVALLSWNSSPFVDSYTVCYRTNARFVPLVTEGFENGLIDWTLRDCAANTAISNDEAYSGQYSFRFGQSDTPQTLIMPELSGVSEGTQLRFYYKSTTENVMDLEVGYSSTDDAPGSFSSLQYALFGQGWHEFWVYIPTGTKYLYLKLPSAIATVYFDDIVIGTYVNEGELQTVEVPSNPYGNTTDVYLTNLIPGTPYMAYVTAECTTSTSMLAHFTTTDNCLAATNLTLGEVGTTTAQLSWSAYPYWMVDEEDDSYTVRYRTTPYTATLFEDGFEDGLGNWTLRNCADGSEVQSWASWAHSGNNFFEFWRSSNPPQYLISPELTGVGDGAKLEFYYKKQQTAYEEYFQVGYSTTDNATESFTFGDEITVSDDNVWLLYSGSVPAGTKYVCVKLNSNNKWSLYVDDVVVSMEIPKGEWQNVAMTANAAAIDFTLSGLMPETSYEAYVYPNCDPNRRTGLVSFTTEVQCVAPTNFAVGDVTASTAQLSWTGGEEVDSYTVSYRPTGTILTQGFENGMGGWNVYNPENGTGITNAYGGHSGSNSFYFKRYSYNQYLVSPELTGVAEGTKVEFYYRLDNEISEGLQVGYSSTDNAIGSFTFGSPVTINDYRNWQLYSATIPAGTKYVCIRRYNVNGVYSYGFYVDDIVIGEDIPAAEWLTATVAGNATELSTTLSGLTESTHYEVYVHPDCTPDRPSETLLFTTGETCPAPTNLTVDEFGLTFADLSWTGEPWVESYMVKYRTDESTFVPVFAEGFESGIGDWTRHNCDNHSVIVTNIQHSGAISFRFSYNLNPPQYLISPMLSGVDEGARLEFYYRNESLIYPETFQIGFSSTDNATESFSFGNQIIATDAQWHLYSGSVPAGTKYICWKLLSYDQNGLYIDDIDVSIEIPESEWQTATTSTTHVELTGLTPETSYIAYVYPDCDPNKVSETVNFTTEAGEVFSITIAGYGATDGNWHLIALPVTSISPDNVTGMTDGDYDLYRFIPTHEDNEWENYKDMPYSLVNGQGYLYARSTDATLTFVETPYSGNGEFALTYDATDDHKCWNLVGNPFNCEATINKEYYVLNADGTGINPVAVPATTPIPPCTAVFVKATATGQTVVFTKVVP